MKCVNCQQETENPKFCSRSCSASYTNKVTPKRKLKRICCKDGCNSLVRNHRSTLCQEHFQGDNIDKKNALLNSTIGEYRDRIRKSKINYHISSLHAGIRGLARIWFKHLTKLPCAHCPYDKHVELAHIEALSSFPDSALLSEVNSKNNIIQLCPNCHWELDNGLWEIGEDGQSRTDIVPLRCYSLEGSSDTSP